MLKNCALTMKVKIEEGWNPLSNRFSTAFPLSLGIILKTNPAYKEYSLFLNLTWYDFFCKVVIRYYLENTFFSRYPVYAQKCPCARKDEDLSRGVLIVR